MSPRIHLAAVCALLAAHLVGSPAVGAVPASGASHDDVAVAIPVSSIAVEGSTLERFLKGVEADLAVPPELQEISETLPGVDAALIELAARTSERLEAGYNRADLESLYAAWQGESRDLRRWGATLRDRLADLDVHRAELIERESIWTETARVAAEEGIPAELGSQITSARESLARVSRDLRKSRDRALGLQRRVVTLQSRVSTGQESLAAARAEELSHLLNRTGEPIWNLRPRSARGLADPDLSANFARTQTRITSYVTLNAKLVGLHLALIGLVVWASWRARIWMQLPPLEGSRPIPAALTHPLAGGLVLGLSAATWIHTDAPPRLWWILGQVTLPFLYFVLRSLLPESFRRPIVGLVLLVLLDFGRRVLMDFDVIARTLLVVEAGFALGGLVWLRRPGRLAEVPRLQAQYKLWLRILAIWLHIGLFVASISLVGAILGWTSLADLLMTALTTGTYVGAILFTAISVVEAIGEASIYSGKVDAIRMLRNHRRDALQILGRIARLTGFATWIVVVSDRLGLGSRASSAAMAVLNAPIGYGNVQLTLGGVAAFGFTIWASWILARFTVTALDDEVFTRVSLPRGVPFALSTVTRYAILVLGFIAAVAALGFEVSNLALLVSALGVGIGFGMQGMVNNFISGLILLFERPIKVGDIVSLEELMGNVARIGIRSSTIRAFDGADVIVPNGDLISNRVTNWTLADKHRRVTIKVGVAYGTSARRVIELLEEVGGAHPAVLPAPAPMGLFVGFGDSSLDFELRVWSESVDTLTTVRSDIAVAIQAALAAAGIEVPFPQRDLHVKDAPRRADST